MRKVAEKNLGYLRNDLSISRNIARSSSMRPSAFCCSSSFRTKASFPRDCVLNAIAKSPAAFCFCAVFINVSHSSVLCVACVRDSPAGDISKTNMPLKHSDMAITTKYLFLNSFMAEYFLRQSHFVGYLEEFSNIV